MVRHLVRRSAALAAVAAMLSSGLALADSVAADGDLVAAGNQGTVDLGTAEPGATLTRDVTFQLLCAGLHHADAGQVVTVSPGTTIVPIAGGSVSASDGVIGPVPDTWVNDSGGGIGCPSSLTLAASTPSHVTIVAPPTPGEDYAFTILFSKALSPAGVADGSSVTGGTGITFVLDVEDGDTTPPTLTGGPADLDLVTGDPAGAILDYPMPTATDDRDPAPVVTCDPAPGALIPVGTTTVTCTATDASGNRATGSFSAVVHLATSSWLEPAADQPVVVRGARTLPLKATASLDGARLAVSDAAFVVRSCAGGAVQAEATATWQADADRWMGLLRTAGLQTGCHTVSLEIDGLGFVGPILEVVDDRIDAGARYARLR